MNIFYLDSDPKKCAEYHVDKHCCKMLLEYSQLLSTAHRYLDGELTTWWAQKGVKKFYLLPGEWIGTVNHGGIDQPHVWNEVCYKHTHINHPCAEWVRHSSGNYLWLLDLLKALHKEYTFRYEKIHKSSALLPFLELLPHNIRKGEMTPPRLAMNEIYKIEDNPIESYHKYYREGKQHLHKWKKREIPEFLLK
jgi:hypothetical protein